MQHLLNKAFVWRQYKNSAGSFSGLMHAESESFIWRWLSLKRIRALLIAYDVLWAFNNSGGQTSKRSVEKSATISEETLLLSVRWPVANADLWHFKTQRTIRLWYSQSEINKQTDHRDTWSNNQMIDKSYHQHARVFNTIACRRQNVAVQRAREIWPVLWRRPENEVSTCRLIYMYITFVTV